MERFKLIASSYLILIRNNKLLLLRRKNTGYEDGNYGLPAGHLEDGESVTEGLCREIKEEIGITLNPKKVSLVHVMHRREKDIRIDLFFTAKDTKGTPINAEPKKCDDLSWFPMNKLPKNTIGYIKQAISNYTKKIFYSERGWK